VWKDPRYVRIVRGVQRKWSKVEVEDLRQLVTADIYSGNVQCWDNVGAYFRRALSNKAFDAHLRRAREETNAVELEKIEQATDAEPPQTPRLKALEDCLTRLSEEEARLKVAFYDQRRPATEIAKTRGTSYDAVLKRLSRLRKKLGDCIRSKV
jgi:RNA polymerase sigma factor (sigma-70 family)